MNFNSTRRFGFNPSPKSPKSNISYSSEMTYYLAQDESRTHLALVDQQLGIKGSQDISTVLRINKSLTTLDICDDSIGNDGVKVLLEGMLYNKTLTKLCLSLPPSCDEINLSYLKTMLKSNNSLKHLVFYRFNEKSQGSKYSYDYDDDHRNEQAFFCKTHEKLADALEKNHTLTHFEYLVGSVKQGFHAFQSSSGSKNDDHLSVQRGLERNQKEEEQ